MLVRTTIAWAYHLLLGAMPPGPHSCVPVLVGVTPPHPTRAYQIALDGPGPSRPSQAQELIVVECNHLARRAGLGKLALVGP